MARHLLLALKCRVASVKAILHQEFWQIGKLSYLRQAQQQVVIFTGWELLTKSADLKND